MKFRITLTLFLAAFAMLNMSAQVIWGGPGDPNGEFDGGLNDWTTAGVSSEVPDSAANAVWVWTADGTAIGPLFGTRPAIASESVGNGAAIFDSDFLDNGGDLFNEEGGVDVNKTGLGPAPAFTTGGFSGAGHSGILTSPTIDCSGQAAVTLRFFSYFRNFSAEMFVDVSNDNGATFTAFPVNTSDANDDTEDNIVTMNISSVAANSDSVRVQFRWTGSYYFWIIDDVSLLQLAGNDLTIVNNTTSPFYTPHSAVQPACAIAIDTFSFSTDVTNSGADTTTNFTYKVEVINNDNETLVYSDSLVLDEFASGISDSTVRLAATWAPEGLDEGVYRIVHSVYTPDNLEDFNPADNSVSQFFAVSASTFAKELGANGAFGTWNDGNFYAIATFYQFGPDCMEDYTVGSVDYAVGQVGADTTDLVGKPVEFWLWKLTMPFDSFDTSTNYEDDIQTISHPSMEFMAFSQDVLDAADAAANVIVSDEVFLDVDAEEVIPMFEAGETYGLFAHWGTQGTTSPLHLFVRDYNTNTDLFYSGGWFGGFTATKSAPILRLQLALVSSVDDQPLVDEAFVAYPNPASDIINFEVNLDGVSNATITIADISGKVISYQNLSNIQREVVSVNVSDYVNGTYLARIATDQGTKTVKFVVQ